MKTRIINEGDANTARLYHDALGHVEETYRVTFAARLTTRPPRLAVTLTREGKIACAAGIRVHDDGFFTQHYLDDRVADVLTRRTGQSVAPADILEVGGLACTSPFSAYPMLRAVFDWGRARGITWGLFTATRDIRRLILRARITPMMLARADAGRVPDPDQWGRYYEHDPWVCAFQDPAQIATTPLLQAESA